MSTLGIIGLMQQRAQKPPLSVYIAAFIVIFFLTLSAADSIGLVPCQFDQTCGQDGQKSEVSAVEALDVVQQQNPQMSAQPAIGGVPPKRITIGAIGLDLPVQNPMTTDLEALDQLLQNGPARHMLSGLLGQDRNMIIFGHSSHLPIVHNKMYQAFNRVPDLVAGNVVEVEGEDGTTYLYSVTAVEKADAVNSDENFLARDQRQLIIVTCDTLTSKSSRYIVRAEYVGTLEH